MINGSSQRPQGVDDPADVRCHEPLGGSRDSFPCAFVFAKKSRLHSSRVECRMKLPTTKSTDRFHCVRLTLNRSRRVVDRVTGETIPMSDSQLPDCTLRVCFWC